jgi:hypothetical protein
VKILLKTERTPAVSKDMGQGQSAKGVAWFELVLHEGPPDEKTWEGGGQTVALLAAAVRTVAKSPSIGDRSSRHGGRAGCNHTAALAY